MKKHRLDLAVLPFNFPAGCLFNFRLLVGGVTGTATEDSVQGRRLPCEISNDKSFKPTT